MVKVNDKKHGNLLSFSTYLRKCFSKLLMRVGEYVNERLILFQFLDRDSMNIKYVS